jgi:hypothetical protein
LFSQVKQASVEKTDNTHLKESQIYIWKQEESMFVKGTKGSVTLRISKRILVGLPGNNIENLFAGFLKLIGLEIHLIVKAGFLIGRKQ